MQKEQLGASFPRKRQVTLEKSTERLGSSREDERGDSGSRNTRDLIYHRPQVRHHYLSYSHSHSSYKHKRLLALKILALQTERARDLSDVLWRPLCASLPNNANQLLRS